MKQQIKTICTIGPASEDPTILGELVANGMDVARLNFSHATNEQFLRVKDLIEEYAIVYGKKVHIMLDLQGPRMRCGDIPETGMLLEEGSTVWFSTDAHDHKAIHINDPFLHEDIKVNHPLYLANGDLELAVTKLDGKRIEARVVRGGILHARKGVNVPETNVTSRGLTEKDIEDVQFGIANGATMVAMSFVKDGEDIRRLRQYIADTTIKIVAKVEIKQALLHLDDIIAQSDIIMVARGDLGIELPLETLPLVQKDIIRRCLKANKPAIVATQMLMSMVDHPRPTRAEVSDAANAVLDGAEYLMLSDETAFGKYPVEALQYLVKTAQKVEEYQYTEQANAF